MEKIAVMGLGYVGLPVALALSTKYPGVLGFDISKQRIGELADGVDSTNEASRDQLKNCDISFSDHEPDLAGHSMYIVTVPTPIDGEKRPNLDPIKNSCRMIAPYLTTGAIVVFESTVYPGVTEDVCGPILEEHSDLKCGTDFFLGYSPERINPGDKINRLETIVKIVSAQNDEALRRVCAVYSGIIEAGLHIAPTIRTAEAAKVIENTQRDLNIALMNELSLIFEKMGIRTKDVLAAANTKWNFLPFTPGLVGGHCIGVDPYYLTVAAERLGYRPEVILAGRQINDKMSVHIANHVIKMLAQRGAKVKGAKIGVLGLTFKEDVPDLRNSKVPDIIAELLDYGADVIINDPHADACEAEREYGLTISPLADFRSLDAVILAVPHRAYDLSAESLTRMVENDGIVIDVKSVFDPSEFEATSHYWSL